MDKKSFSIGILFLTAVVLFFANMMPTRSALAADSVKERDFTLVTSQVVQGGEGLYVVDNRTGQIAVFIWDPASRTVRLRDLKPILDMFHD